MCDYLSLQGKQYGSLQDELSIMLSLTSHLETLYLVILFIQMQIILKFVDTLKRSQNIWYCI